MKKSIIVNAICAMPVLLFSTGITFGQVKPNKGTFSQAFPSPKSVEVINYPPHRDMMYLRRNHIAYNPSTHSYDQDYLKRKYQLIFKLPSGIARSIGFTIPARTGPNGEYIKPSRKTEWFSAIININNLNNKKSKYIKINDLVLRGALDFYITSLIEGPGNYEIRFEQTFPAEAAFRQIVQKIFMFPGDGEPVSQQERIRVTDSIVNIYRDVLGKRTSQPIYRFAANYDFLVAAIGDSFASGEGNPMGCGKDLPENGIFDSFSEVYHDIKDHASSIANGIMDADKEGLIDAIKGTAAIYTLSPVIEQVVGPCEITTLNMAGLTQPNFDVPPGWIENGAENELRVSRSYINPTAPASFAIEDKYRGMVVTYLNYASSGATLDNLTQKNQHGFQQVNQIDELAKNLRNTGREIDALTIAIGANDVQFSDVMGRLIGSSTRDLIEEFGFISPAAKLAVALTSGSLSKDAIEKTIQEDLNKLEQKFAFLDYKIKSTLQVKKVFLMEYPNAQFSVKVNGRNEIRGGCGVLNLGPIKFTAEHAAIIKETGDLLNQKLKALAQKYNWEFVEGATNAFLGHGYCASSSESYYRAAETSCGCQGNYQGILHPNLKGFTAIKPLMLSSFEKAFPFNQLRQTKYYNNDQNTVLIK
jgi:hypothetical protein